MAKKFPHLLPDDRILWERFLKTDFNIFQRFDYDVRVGDTRDPGPAFSPNIRQMAMDLSQRRIDAIGFTPHSVTIIEISTNAGLTQIGQLEVYPVLYRESYQPKLTLKTLLIAENVQLGIEPALISKKLEYLLLPADQ